MPGSAEAKVGALGLRVVLDQGELELAAGRLRPGVCVVGGSTGDRSGPDPVAH
jgi:hypothetical protein